MRNDQTALETALQLLRRGLRPVPVHPPGVQLRNGGGVSVGKEPMGKAWGKTKPTEAQLISAFEKDPGAGVGILLGPNGGVIDFDIDGPKGEASLKELLRGEIIPTLGWSSRRGAHWLYRYEPRFEQLGKSITKLPGLPDLEIRIGGNGKQSQSVCPPSIGLDGIARRWNDCDEIATLPEVVIASLERACRQEPSRCTTEPSKAANRATKALARPRKANGTAYGEKALREECELVARAVEGNRHDTLRDCALRIGSLAKSGLLDWGASSKRLTNAATGAGLDAGEIRELLELASRTAQPRPSLDAVIPERVDKGGKLTPSPNNTHVSTQTEHKSSDNTVAQHKASYDTHAQPKENKHVCHSGKPCGSDSDLEPCGSNLTLKVQNVIQKHAYFEQPDKWWNSIFKLCRELLETAREEGWQLEIWESVARYWMVVCGDTGLVLPPWHTVWREFEKKLSVQIKQPYGEVADRVRERIPNVKVPPVLAGNRKLESLAKVMIALAKEHVELGRTEFYATHRFIGELGGGINHKTAYKRLAAISQMGFLSLIEAGTQGTRPGGKASIWRWHDPPCPGKTVWNRTPKKLSSAMPLTVTEKRDLGTASFEIDHSGQAEPPTLPLLGVGPTALPAQIEQNPIQPPWPASELQREVYGWPKRWFTRWMMVDDDFRRKDRMESTKAEALAFEQVKAEMERVAADAQPNA